MPVQEILFYLLAAANLINLVHLGLYVIGANTYDTLSYIKAAKLPKAAAGRKTLPLVSVVIPAHNEALAICRTLDSVWASSYSNIEVIVMDDGSTDRTEQVVRDHVKRLPTIATKSYFGRVTYRSVSQSRQYESRQVLRRRYLRMPATRVRTVSVIQANAGKAAAMNNAIHNHIRGEFVMCLDADSMLHPQAIERAVTHLENPKVIGVAANVRVMESSSIIGIVQRFEHLVGYRSKKFYNLTNSEFVIGGVASTYRVSAIKEVDLYDTDTLTEDIGLSLKLIAHGGNRRQRIIYAADVVAFTEGVQTFRALLRQRYRWKMGNLQNLFKYRSLIGRNDHAKYSRMLTKYRLPMALLSEIMLMFEPLLILYIIVMSLAYHTPAAILGAYLTITLYVMLTIWPDEHMSVRQKLKMSAMGLAMYGLFYIISIVQVAAIFKCLRHHKQLTKRTAAVTWTSPARLGPAAV